MADLISRAPRTMMEVFKMLPEGTLAELVEDNLIMSPAPSLNHQDVVTLLSGSFVALVRNKKVGRSFVSPIDVYLDEVSNVVQPDIVFVLNENLSILKKDGIHGVPDIVVEAVSPGNRDYDFVKKKDIYEKFGVREYWIVDPDTRSAVGYALEGGRYVEFCSAVGRIESRLLNEYLDFTDPSSTTHTT
jgi:Uma2 family endonuclease